jgi:hypothetical protein
MRTEEQLSLRFAVRIRVMRLAVAHMLVWLAIGLWLSALVALGLEWLSLALGIGVLAGCAAVSSIHAPIAWRHLFTDGMPPESAVERDESQSALWRHASWLSLLRPAALLMIANNLLESGHRRDAEEVFREAGRHLSRAEKERLRR